MKIAICDDEKYILDKIKKLVFDFFHGAQYFISGKLSFIMYHHDVNHSSFLPVVKQMD